MKVVYKIRLLVEIYLLFYSVSPRIVKLNRITLIIALGLLESTEVIACSELSVLVWFSYTLSKGRLAGIICLFGVGGVKASSPLLDPRPLVGKGPIRSLP